MDLIKKVSILVFVVCFLTLRNQRALNDLHSTLEDPLVRRNLWEEPRFDGAEEKSLKYDFYTTSCPSVEKTIRSTVRELHQKNNTVGPQLLRLAFHDCFVEAGGQFYPVFTDRKDSRTAHFQITLVGKFRVPTMMSSKYSISLLTKDFR